MDIENLCIVFAPNIIECLETADMHTTLIAPLHIINSIIRYFEKIRMKVIIYNCIYIYIIINIY